MNPGHAPAIRDEAIERCLTRLRAHLERLGRGQDPFGHLFSIERLARSARADWCAAQRQAAPGRDEW